MFVDDLVIVARYTPPKDQAEKWAQEERLAFIIKRAKVVFKNDERWMENFDAKEASNTEI